AFGHCVRGTDKMLQVTAETALSMASYVQTYLSESVPGARPLLHCSLPIAPSVSAGRMMRAHLYLGVALAARPLPGAGTQHPGRIIPLSQTSLFVKFHNRTILYQISALPYRVSMTKYPSFSKGCKILNDQMENLGMTFAMSWVVQLSLSRFLFGMMRL